jgi:hypothetical protein
MPEGALLFAEPVPAIGAFPAAKDTTFDIAAVFHVLPNRTPTAVLLKDPDFLKYPS